MPGQKLGQFGELPGGRIVEVYRAANGPSSVPEMPEGDGFLYVDVLVGRNARAAKKAIKKLFEERYQSGKNRWFFTPLRF